MKKEKLIIICVVIIAVGLIFSQIIKSDAAKEQAQMKIDQENKVLQMEKDRETKLAEDEAFNKLMINACIDDAGDTYWNYVKLNGTENEDGTVWAKTSVWDTAKKDKKDAIDLCYKKYN